MILTKSDDAPCVNCVGVLCDAFVLLKNVLTLISVHHENLWISGFNTEGFRD